jgi:iron-sulfur cluster repair protein YtfE (RIC family)
MKATALLKKQHRKVEGIFEQLAKGPNDAAALVSELANDLAAHMAIEQTIFYPAIRDIDPKTVGESYQEHAIAEIALKRLLSTSAKDPTFEAKATALKELIEHHVEEEEDELFPEVEDKMDPDQLEALGDEMEAAFEEASEQGYGALLPEGIETSADGANPSEGTDGAERPARRAKKQRVRRPVS